MKNALDSLPGAVSTLNYVKIKGKVATSQHAMKVRWKCVGKAPLDVFVEGELIVSFTVGTLSSWTKASSVRVTCRNQSGCRRNLESLTGFLRLLMIPDAFIPFRPMSHSKFMEQFWRT